MSKPKHPKAQKRKKQIAKKPVKKSKAFVKKMVNQWLRKTNKWLAFTVAIIEIYDRLIKPVVDFCQLHWQGWP
ncbi:MAG TPA: hypothetical protein VIJ92_01395 [Ginsengibacter sp.]